MSRRLQRALQRNYQSVNWQRPLNPDSPFADSLQLFAIAAPPLRHQDTWRFVKGGAGTLTNSPQWSTQAPPGGWGSLSFDGADNYVSIADAPSLSPPTITVAIWGNLTSLANTNPMLACKRTGGDTTASSWDFVREAASGRVVFRIYVTGSGTIYSAQSDADIALNQWAFWVGTYDGNTVRIYRDGVPQSATATVAGSLKTNSFPIWVGAGSDDTLAVVGTTPWIGYLSTPLIFGRALSAAEVAALHAESRAYYPTLLRRQSRRSYFVPQAFDPITFPWLQSPPPQRHKIEVVNYG